MQIRPARLADLELLNQIALTSKAHWGYSAAQMAVWEADLLTNPETIDAWPTFVAEVQEHPVAFAQVNPNIDPWELISLWVLPAHMGKGIGKALLTRVLGAASAIGQQVLAIDSDPNAAPFYLACGAIVVGETAAPIPGDGTRMRPRFILKTKPA